jgi:hypothetical protein
VHEGWGANTPIPRLLPPEGGRGEFQKKWVFWAAPPPKTPIFLVSFTGMGDADGKDPLRHANLVDLCDNYSRITNIFRFDPPSFCQSIARKKG